MLYEEIMGPGGTAELRARAGATFGTISALHEAWKCGSLPSNAQERAKELLELASKNRQHGPHPLAEIDVGHELWKLHHEYPWQDGYAIRNHIGALW